MKKEIMRVTAFSILSIGVLGGAFVGINQIALANESSNTERIEPVTTEVNSYGFQELDQALFDITVLETSLKDRIPEEMEWFLRGFSFDKPENALSREEAAQMGAQYIYDMLGENIEGKFVAMTYYDRDSQARPYWQGRVGSSEESFENWEHDFEFFIDAVTGEWVGIDNQVGLDRSESALSNLSWDDSISLSNEQIVKYRKVINDFAEIHFTNSTVDRIDFIGVDWLGATKDDNGELVPEYIARFNVIDDTGRVAAAAVTLESQQLRHFCTFGSDNIHIQSDRENRTPMNENSPTKEWVLTSGETILIVDNTWLLEADNSDQMQELQPHNLSIEEAAEIGAGLIYEEFGESVDGTRFDKVFSTIGGREFWNATVYDDEGKALFYYVIDARTGEKIELSMNTDETPFLG